MALVWFGGYIVAPKTSQQEDRDHLTVLAQIFGVGLVLFNADNKQQPDFDIQVRAARNEPNYFCEPELEAGRRAAL